MNTETEELKVKEVIFDLLAEIKRLSERVDSIEKSKLPENNFLLAQGSLQSIWDNEKDDIWNDL